MRCPRLLALAVPLLAALGCKDVTAPPTPAVRGIRAQQLALATPSTTPQVSAGYAHACALKTDGTVVCWGYNGTVGTATASGQATVPAGLTSVAQVSAGIGLNCALKTDGTVVCWGDNNFGQTTVPSGLASVAQVSAGYHFSCALTSATSH